MGGVGKDAGYTGSLERDNQLQFFAQTALNPSGEQPVIEGKRI